jgi:hypothetical protein
MECCPVRSIRYPAYRKLLNRLTYLHRNHKVSPRKIFAHQPEHEGDRDVGVAPVRMEDRTT